MAKEITQGQYDRNQAALKRIKENFTKLSAAPNEAYQQLRFELNYGQTMARKLVLAWINETNNRHINPTNWRTDLQISDLERD
jgi:hypothetical protein